jgi:hypothetical protein
MVDEFLGAMRSSQFGQEHMHLSAARAQAAVASDRRNLGLARADCKALFGICPQGNKSTARQVCLYRRTSLGTRRPAAERDVCSRQKRDRALPPVRDGAMDHVKHLREQAERCFRLGQDVTNRELRTRLEVFGRDFAQRAD